MTRSPSGEVRVAESGEGDDFVPLPLATDLPAGTRVGEYTIERKLGDGGMATVYGATHPLIGKKAAIKVMNPALSLDAGLVERFVLEAQAVNHIGHPNIVDVFSFGQLGDGRSYFVMEWLPGDTLYARLWERRLTLDEALDIIDQMCDALEAAHEAGIVHRDLKPANVFLVPRRNGRRDLVKLLDFGVAKLTRHDDAPAGLSGPQTEAGQVVGTPEYIAPEQARGKNVDGKCDVYAMGVIAYEMILGQRPFLADNNADLVRMHLSEPPPPPKALWPEIPLPLDDLMQAMLAKQAQDRPLPHEVRAVIRELRGTPPPFDFTEESSFTPAPSSFRLAPMPSLPPPQNNKRNNKRLLIRAVGVGLLACGAAMVGAIVWRHHALRLELARPAIVATAHAEPSLSANTTAPSALGSALSPNGTAAPANATAPSPNAAAVSPRGTVVVRVDAPDARIELDGVMVAQAASGARVPATTGEHQLSVTAPSRKPFSSRVTVGDGAVVEVEVRLHGKSAPPRPVAKPAVKRNDPDYLVDPFSGAK